MVDGTEQTWAVRVDGDGGVENVAARDSHFVGWIDSPASAEIEHQALVLP